MMWIGISLAVFAALSLFVAAIRESIVSHTDHPKVTDEEFLAALPGVTPAKALRIRAIIADQLDIPIHDLHPNDRFIEDLKAG